MGQSHLRNNILIVLVGTLLFLPFLGSVHLFDWDEINFAECAREMIVTGNYSQVQIDFQPFWEKPPLFIWMQVLSMKIFGINEFAARFPNAICGIITLLVIYNIGRRLFSEKFGLLWTLVYAGSFLTFFYFKSGIIDPWFNLFIFSGIYYAIVHTNNPAGKSAVVSALLAGMFIGLSVLTKGPVGVLIFGITVGVIAILKRFKGLTKPKYLFLFLISFALFGFGWFGVEILRGNFEIVKQFVIYQIRLFNTEDSGHGGFLLYHFVVLLIGCFPASVFFLQSHKKSESDTPYQKHFKKWMIVLFWVVLILFTIVQTKIVHYSSMCWFPLTFLSAYSIYKMLQGEWQLKRWVMNTGIFLTVLFGVLFTLIPLVDVLKPYIIKANIIADKFAVKNLDASGNWIGLEWLPGLLLTVLMVYLFVVIRSKQKVKFIPVVFGASLITVFTVSAIIVPKVEMYSQGAAIEFYKSMKGKDVYLETCGFKSYAYLFYAEKRPELNTPEMLKYTKELGEKEIREGLGDPTQSFARYCVSYAIENEISKPSFLIFKCTEGDDFVVNHPKYRKYYEKNGFVFVKRNADKKP